MAPWGSVQAQQQQPQSQVPAQFRPPCPIPRDVFLAYPFGNLLAMYDMRTMRPVCIVQLPDGPPAQFAVSQDGRIFVAVRSTKMTDFSTDAGHVDVIGPDGRLLHRFTQGIVGPWDIAVDRSGRNFFLYSDGDMTLNGAEAGGWTPTLGMYDADTGKLLRTYSLDPDQLAYSYFTVSPDGRAIDVAYSGKRSRVETLDAASGALLRTAPVPKTRSPREIAGVLYSDDVRAEEPSPGSNVPFDSVTTITRTIKASGQRLPPIVIRMLLNGYDVIHPDQNLAGATPGPDAREPVFSSAAQIRRSVPAAARGVQFDDAISGARYTYLGAYARADDPRAHAITIVDCARGLALIADTQKSAYIVRRMDATTLTERAPQRPEPKQINPRPTVLRTPNPRIKPDISYTVTPLTRAQLHSPLARIGFAKQFDFYPMGRVLGGQTMSDEVEYAGTPAPYPSCLNHPFGGEPLAITPQTIPMLSDTIDSLDPRILPFVHRSGTPQDVSKNFLVYMARGSNGPLKAVFEIRKIRPVSVGGGSLFAPPPGYAQDRSPEY